MLQALPRERLPRPRRRRAAATASALAAARAEAPDREDAVRDLDRGDALLPERHLPSHARRHPARTVLRAVATDGHRLARVEIAGPGRASEGMPGVIMPRKAVAEIIKLVEDAGEERRVELSPDQDPPDAAAGVVLTSKLIDGTFPDYQRVIPAGNDKQLVVERADFAAAVDRVSTISSERGRAVKLVADRRPADAVGEQPGFRLGHRGDRGRLRRRPARYRLQRPLPARHHRRSSTATPPCSSWPIPARRR